MADHVMRATEPRTRIRINHSRTIKEGWQYETTVEVEWDGWDDETGITAWNRLDWLLGRARLLGEMERDARNQRDGSAA